jgi:hypothetical protein
LLVLPLNHVVLLMVSHMLLTLLLLLLLKLGVSCSGIENICKCSAYAADNPWEQRSQVVALQHGLCLADPDADCYRVWCCTAVSCQDMLQPGATEATLRSLWAACSSLGILL